MFLKSFPKRKHWSKHRPQGIPLPELQTLPFVEYVGKGEEKQNICGWTAHMHMSVIMEE